MTDLRTSDRRLENELKPALSESGIHIREYKIFLMRPERADAGRDGRIIAIINGPEDPDIVAKLYRASMAGVEINLIVQDIFRLRR